MFRLVTLARARRARSPCARRACRRCFRGAANCG